MRFVYAISFVTVLALSGAGAQQTEPARSAGASADPRLKQFDKDGDGKISDSERQAVREKMSRVGARNGPVTPSKTVQIVGDREISELEYASSDGRKIPCVLSMPKGDGPFPCVVTIHGGQGNRDLGYIRTLAAPNPISPTVNALNEQPWAILAISYRAGDGALFGMEEDDVVAGIRFAKTLPKIDPARVGALGGSHGGFLALRAAELMGGEFLCVAVGSPWMTDPFVYMTGKADEPPLSQIPAAAREQIMTNGQHLFNGLYLRSGSEAEARRLMGEHSIEANAEKIVIPALFLTSLADEEAPHLLVKPTFDKMKAAGRDVTVFTVEKSPHGFYWGRDVGGARIGKGEKTEEELAEEKATREQIVAFFAKQFAGKGLPVVASAQTAAPAAPPATAGNAGKSPDSTEKPVSGASAESTRGGFAQRAAGRGEIGGGAAGRNPEETFEAMSGGGDKVSKAQFKEHFSKQGGPLADRPEMMDRLFDRLDADKDGALSLEEYRKISGIRGGGGRGPTNLRPASSAVSRPGAPPKARAETKAEGKRSILPSQAQAVSKLRSRMANMPVPDNLQRRAIKIGDKEREYFIHVPESAKSKAAPVVFALHGGASSSGLAQHYKADYTQIADREGFVVVYPSGVNGWNIGSHDAYSVQRRTSNADDVGFFRAMFDTLIDEGVAEPKRIYVTGGSNGGVMTQYLACNMADRIAGIGVVVATLPKAVKDWPKPSRPIPLLIMLGTADTFKPWNGTVDQLSAEETVKYWRDVNGCSGEPAKADLPDLDPNDGCRVHAQRWEGKAPVVFYTMEGHGHGWPMPRGRQETGTGPKTQDISAPEEFWAFLKDCHL